MGRVPRCDVPPKKEPEHLPPEMVEFVRQQHEDAKFRAKLWATLRRWAIAVFTVFLGATSGLEAVTKLIERFKGPSP